MTGMDEMPGGRPLTLGGWPGKGVSAGDKGKLLYRQHTGDAARDYEEEHKHLHSKTRYPLYHYALMLRSSFSSFLCHFL